ncbi:peptidoglycan recognition protein 5 [Oryzias melastigma]|uniref:Peptidoglycan recognition protein 5 n=1 Tax=Oryzias melastigma TaxID=30732 RepID=A0A3B3C118_ORYME|nr:peptidoglycan recognition protein 5 [Oryzias melastigma]
MEQTVNIVSRLQWGAAAPKQKEALKGSAQRVVIHHTALQNCRGLPDSKEHLVSIQSMHMNQRGFDDIGYNFLIGGDGTVFEGRGWGVVGAHTKGHNQDSLGIAFMGNFNSDKLTEEALRSVKGLLLSGVSQNYIDPEFVLYGHRDLASTQCPGDNVYAALSHLRSGA